MGGRRLTILGLVGALALLPGSAGAEAPTETLRAAAERVTGMLGEPSLQADAPALGRVSAPLVFAELPGRCVAHWCFKNCEEEWIEFIHFFPDILCDECMPQIKLYQ